MNAAAVLVLGFIQIVLLGLGEMPTVFGLVGAFTFSNVGVVRFIACGLLAADLAVGLAFVDAVLLIIEALVDFIHARMIGHWCSLRRGVGSDGCSR